MRYGIENIIFFGLQPFGIHNPIVSHQTWTGNCNAAGMATVHLSGTIQMKLFAAQMEPSSKIQTIVAKIGLTLLRVRQAEYSKSVMDGEEDLLW